MYNVFINISLIVLSLFSAVANSSQCLVNQGNSSYLIDGSKDFCMTFTVKADGRNRVRVKLDRYYKPIWTDQLQFKNNAIFYEDEYLNDPNKHEFQIQFTRNSAGSGYIYGTLRYYIDGKLKKEQSNFNLTSFAKVTTGNPFFILQAPTYPLNQPNKLCVTPISCTITSSFPTDAHYEFGVHKCNSMPCDIPITRTDYRNAPLVFVMPTINTVHPDKDAPSRLYISSELKKDSTSFTISQHTLQSLSNRFDEKPMTEISYFIMEPGATIIDGHKVIAGFLETDKVNRKYDSVESMDTNFSNFDIGFKGFNEEPVILHQIQTNNNKSVWMTSGRHWSGQDSKKKVALFLEQSFSNDSRIKKEKISFLATEPSDRLNVTDSKVGNHLLEFKLTSTHRQPENFKIPCNNMVATTNLQISGIILNKQQRKESDGGWLRRCKIQGNQASIVVDENNRFRSHRIERIGYLAFEQIAPPTTPKITQLRIKPNNYHLTCESDDKKIVEVQMLDKDGNLVVGTQPSLTLTQEGGTNLNITLDTEKDGVATFKVATQKTSAMGEYDLKASLTVNGAVLTDSAKIKYVPYKFAVANQQVVAGKKNTVSITVKVCAQDGKVVTTGYTGQPSVDFTYLLDSLKHPAVKDVRDLGFDPQFRGGSTSAEMRFKESGKIKVTLRDANFTCDPTQYRCPMNGGALKGEFEVSARPWKIAICDIKSKSDSKVVNPATKGSGKGFIASGEKFSMTYRPVIHPDSSGGYLPCDSNYPITSNYGLDNGKSSVDHILVYPNHDYAWRGQLEPRDFPVSFDKDHLTRTIDYSWNEVGTLKIETKAKYLGMDIETDTQEVGRFYPKYFKVLDGVKPKWDYPGSEKTEQDFVYMNQPFDGLEFQVEALNAQEVYLNNYGLFDPRLTANFSVYEASSGLSRRFHSVTPSKHWERTTIKGNILGHSIGTFKWNNSTNSTDCSKSLCWAKATSGDSYQDGPFNIKEGDASTKISIVDVGSEDPISYPEKWSPRVLKVQPRILFGRAIMDSVGGVTGTNINIPFRIEFWDGAQFITHSGDNFTNISGFNIASANRELWLEAGSTAMDVIFTGGGRVSNGGVNSIRVTQTPHSKTKVRQQTQAWLELSSGGNNAPWLRYRWQDSNRVKVDGEQDPSTVITFGIHRGNDRVIYRGETGILGF